MSDDILEAEAYFNRRFSDEKAEEREQKKARRELRDAQKTDERPEHGQTLLRRIVADADESRSIRQDAQRLLDLAEIAPRRFSAEYSEFIAWYAENK